MIKQTKAAIKEMMQLNHEQSDLFGIIVLNGGFELTIRGMLMYYLQQQFRECIVVAEHTLQSNKDKRADIALLDAKSPHSPNGLIELKGNFLSQATEITGIKANDKGATLREGRYQSDANKWQDGQFPPVLYLYFVFEVPVETPPPALCQILKPYVVRDAAKNKALLARVQDYFLKKTDMQVCAFTDTEAKNEISGNSVCGPAFITKCNYPDNNSQMTFKTHFFLLQKPNNGET